MAVAATRVRDPCRLSRLGGTEALLGLHRRDTPRHEAAFSPCDADWPWGGSTRQSNTPAEVGGLV